MNDERDWAAIDRRDRELGSVLSSWASSADVAVELLGPLEAPGMDPTWIARFWSEAFEADAHLFRGPYLGVSAFRADAPHLGVLVGGEEGLSESRLVEMLNDLALASHGGPLPSWLRPAVP